MLIQAIFLIVCKDVIHLIKSEYLLSESLITITVKALSQINLKLSAYKVIRLYVKCYEYSLVTIAVNFYTLLVVQCVPEKKHRTLKQRDAVTKRFSL